MLKLLEFYEAFTTARAIEAQAVFHTIGEREWVWFLAGLIPMTLFITFMRVTRILPNERSWYLSVIRLFAALVNYLLLLSLLIVVTYMYFYYVGAELTLLFVAHYSEWILYGASIGLIFGFLIWVIIARNIEPIISENLHKKTKRTDLNDTLTDIRTRLNSLFPGDKKKLCFTKVFTDARKRNSIFLGIDQHGKSVLIPINKFDSSHIQICGPTGTGKGVQAAIVLVQALLKGDAVFIIDPKNDEWAASVISQECDKQGIPFIYIDLNKPVPQINIFKGATADQVFEVFVAGLGLDEKGEAADFYRIDDREAAYELAQEFIKNRDLSLSELYDMASNVLDSELYENAKGFLSRLKQLARIKAIQTRSGADLNTVLKQGGAIYIVGATRGQDIPALQKMLALRVIQIIENKRAHERHSCILFDEGRYTISSPVINAYGIIRHKNCSIITTHQSLKDFRDCNKDLNPETVEGAILTNTQIKWIYRATDPDTVEWAAKMTGKILVNKQRRTVERNEFLSETTSSERTLDQVERYAIDENTIMSLPDGCALCIGVGQAKLALAQPIPTIKRQFNVTPAPMVPRKSTGQDLLDTDQPQHLLNNDKNTNGDELL